MDQARVVVIGGGITGCSVAYHLAEAGWTDVLLVEKAQLTAGSTCQAAGVVTVFNPSATMMRFRSYSVELYERLGVFERSGSLRLASSHDQLRELERAASRARGIGLDAEVVSADEARRRMPALGPADLFGAVHLAQDGYLDPHTATHAVADAARSLGVRIRTGVRVTGIELDARRAVTAVLTDQGPITTELVVDAAGIWAPQVAAMAGAFIASTPVDHQHIALRAVPGSELPRDMPCFRDPDNLVYGKSEQGGMLFGGYEAEPTARWIDGVPWDHAATSLPPDYERFAPLMAGAIRRFPFLADAEVIRLVCHPDAMTPDANPLLGPLPGLHGFWVAAGLSLNGFGGGGGIGRALVGWTSRRTARGGSAMPIATRPGQRPRRARPTPTTTGSVTRMTRTRPAGRTGSRRSTVASRMPVPCSSGRPAGNGPTSIDPASRGVVPGATSAPMGGRALPGSTVSCRRPAPSASEPGSSI